jgi:hypothetical protein
MATFLGVADFEGGPILASSSVTTGAEGTYLGVVSFTNVDRAKVAALLPSAYRLAARKTSHESDVHPVMLLFGDQTDGHYLLPDPAPAVPTGIHYSELIFLVPFVQRDPVRLSETQSVDRMAGRRSTSLRSEDGPPLEGDTHLGDALARLRRRHGQPPEIPGPRRHHAHPDSRASLRRALFSLGVGLLRGEDHPGDHVVRHGVALPARHEGLARSLPLRRRSGRGLRAEGCPLAARAPAGRTLLTLGALELEQRRPQPSGHLHLCAARSTVLAFGSG